MLKSLGQIWTSLILGYQRLESQNQKGTAEGDLTKKTFTNRIYP